MFEVKQRMGDMGIFMEGYMGIVLNDNPLPSPPKATESKRSKLLHSDFTRKGPVTDTISAPQQKSRGEAVISTSGGAGYNKNSDHPTHLKPVRPWKFSIPCVQKTEAP